VSALRIGDHVRQLRRDAGPVAWYVFEELAFDAVRDGDELVASTSVRELAAAVSLNKDTVARAVAVLVRLGVVDHHQPASGGRFGAGRYSLTLPEGLDVTYDDASAPPLRRKRTHAATHARLQQPSQLSLLDLDAADPSPSPTPSPTADPQHPDALAPEVSRRPARPARDENVSGGTPLRDENGTAGRTVQPC